MTEFAEEFKKSGNEAFAAKRYEDACTLYEKAIEANPSNYVYYNNMAAAQHELKNYDAAITFAQKAVGIQDNAKSHARMGASFWCQKKFADAKKEYEKASSMDSSNAEYKSNVTKLSQLMSGAPTDGGAARHPYFYRNAAANSGPQLTLLGGEFTSVDMGALGIFMSVALGAICAACVLASFVSPPLAWTLWNVLLAGTIVQQALVAYKQGVLKVSLDCLSDFGNHFSTLLLALCAFALLIGVRPITFMPMFMTLYNVLDLINKKDQLPGVLGPLYNVAAPYIQMGVDRKMQILVLAATIEAFLVFTVMLTGGTYFTLVYIQYGKNRFRKDGYIKLAYTGLRMNLTNLLTKPFVPAIVNSGFQKFCDLLLMVAEKGL